jgi:hypothetical protein
VRRNAARNVYFSSSDASHATQCVATTQLTT